MTRIARVCALLLPLVLLAAACGDGEDGPAGASPDDGGIEGELNVSGSSTVEPISTRVAENFEEVEPGVIVNVDGPGTGDGFELFCNGETDISDASRPIKEEEAAACEENSVDFVELKVAFDGISVLTSPANDVECLTFADLYALIGPESEDFENWSDAEALAAELGSSTQFPDAPLDIVGPGEESGTYDSFIEIALGDIAAERVAAGEITEDQAETTRASYQSSPDDNTIIQGVEGSDSSLGWVGFAFAEEAGDEVKEVAIDGGDGCVEPSTETIADGSYPISRPLFVYVSAASLEDNPAAAAYVDYYLNDGIGAVEEVGYVALPEDQLEATRTVFEDRTTGSQAAA